jgi:ferritin-like metal-binding protein YciE
MASDTPDVLIDTGDAAQQAAGKELVAALLREAGATESALVTTLSAHLTVAPEGEYRAVLERHLAETRDQAEAVAERLDELGAGGGALDGLVGLAETLVGQALSLAKGPVDLLRGGTSQAEKVVKNARDEAATEAFEIAHYDALAAVAKAVGDSKTQKLARDHRAQEEQMLDDLRRLIPQLSRDLVRAEA